MSMRRAILVLTSLAAVVVSGQTAVWRYLTSSHARPRPFTSRRYMAQPTVRNVASTYASGDPPTSQGSRWSMSPAEQRAFNDGLQAALLAVCIMKGEDSPLCPNSGDDVCLGCENLSHKQSQLVARIKVLQGASIRLPIGRLRPLGEDVKEYGGGLCGCGRFGFCLRGASHDASPSRDSGLQSGPLPVTAAPRAILTLKL
jgi:hypothetical protein